MNQACAAFDGASKMTFAGPTASAISPISSVRMPPEESKIPAVPPSRASVITFHAPASRSSLQPRDPLVGRVLDGRVLRADLGEDGEVAREVGDQLELPLARDVDRAVGDLDVREAEPLQPRACTRRGRRSRRPTSKNVPPMTTGFSRSTASLRSRFCVTYAVPQPSLTIEM